MAVLMIGVVPDMTEEMYAGMVGQLEPRMRGFQGFISHAGGPNPGGGWRVVEVWATEDDSERWFDENVKPNLPPGTEADRTTFPIHTVFTK